MLTCLRKSFELIEQHYGEDARPRHAEPDDRQGLRDAVQGRTRSACSRSRAGRRCRCCRGSSHGVTTTSSSRWRSCGQARSRAAWCIPTCKNRDRFRRQIDYPSAKLEKILRADARRAAVPGAGDADRHRLRRLPAGQGRQAAPRDGDVPPVGHDPQAQGRLHQRHGRATSTSGSSPSAASSRSRASASTAFPRATPRASRSSSTSRPG